MATNVILPKQGLQMTEGTLTQWLVKEGGDCKEGEPLFEMETDKLTITMDSPATGKLLKIIHGAGDTVPITKTIAIIGEAGEDISALLAEAAPAAAPAAPAAQSDPSAPAAAPAAAPTSNYEYDVAILGAGPGGYECAIRCAQLGLKAALIENRELGGTCLNRGCIPTKALLHAAEVYDEIKGASVFGISVGEPSVDFAKTAAFKNAKVAQLRGGVEMLEKRNGVAVIRGTGKLTDVHTIAVDGKNVTAGKIVLATGSAPAQPPIPGIKDKNVITSDEVLSMTTLPDSFVIIGGGVIGIEFATLFATLGKPVTVLEMLPTIMPGTDPEIVDIIKKVLAKRGVKIVNNAKVLGFHGGDTVTVDYEFEGKTVTAQGACCVVSIGRKPLTRDIGLEDVGVAVSKRGFVEINDKLETSVPGIYAIGDITGKIQLAHVATAQGLVAAANCAGQSKTLKYDIVPACIYTNPEISFVGMSEEAAKKAGKAVKIGRFSVAGNGRCVAMNAGTGLVKIIADERTGEIYGAQICAPRATDLIAEIAAVMKCEGTIEELADTIHPHPTVSEIVMQAAHDAEGLCCDAMPKRK